MKILVATEKPFAKKAVDGIRQIVEGAGYELALLEKYTDKSELLSAVADVDALIIRSDKVTAEVIEAARNLKIVVRAGAGYDNVDLAAATARGIVVMNTPGQNSNAVAELALAMMIFMARNGFTPGTGSEIQGKTLGIVGFGRIGQHLGVMAKAIGMTVIAFDIFHIPGIEEQLGIPYVEMDELLAKSDFISVHAPAVDGGALINAERIAKMKDGVCIINTSRGTNVDEAALLAALESGKVRAAGLDVYADEPASNSALYSHPMVSCTPHIGAATVEAQKRIGAEIVDIITNFGK